MAIPTACSVIFRPMTLLVVYVLVALVFSFLCSIAEAVLLSVTTPYILLLERQNRPAGKLLRELKSQVNQPLTAILTLNTIAHTVGAAGAGAQVAAVFGSVYLGAASVVLVEKAQAAARAIGDNVEVLQGGEPAGPVSCRPAGQRRLSPLTSFPALLRLRPPFRIRSA